MQIYKTTNHINGKVYIGQNLTSDENYIGSGTLLWRAIKKYGIENFTKEVIEEILFRDFVDEREIYWISYYRSVMPPRHVYNILPGGHGFGDIMTYHPDRDTIIAKRSKTTKANIALLKEEEKKLRFGRHGEQNGRWRGGISSQKHYCKCGNEMNYNSLTCNKCIDRTGINNSFAGKTHSIEAKASNSSKHMGKKPSNRLKVEINNITYDSISDACKALNCCRQTLKKRYKL